MRTGGLEVSRRTSNSFALFSPECINITFWVMASAAVLPIVMLDKKEREGRGIEGRGEERGEGRGEGRGKNNKKLPAPTLT